MSAQLSPEDVVRKFFDCYTNGRPEDFDEVVAPDYLDYGHTPPGRGPGGARDDYENAVKQAAWTGTLPGRRRDRQGAEPVPHLRRTAPLDPARPDRDHALMRILWSTKAARAAGTGQLVPAANPGPIMYQPIEGHAK